MKLNGQVRVLRSLELNNVSYASHLVLLGYCSLGQGARMVSKNILENGHLEYQARDGG
jgi:hypothetical protein